MAYAADSRALPIGWGGSPGGSGQNVEIFLCVGVEIIRQPTSNDSYSSRVRMV